MPGAQPLKLVCQATKMCTPGAGCTLRFVHWCRIRKLLLDLPQEVARGAYFHGRDIFLALKYFTDYVNSFMAQKCTVVR